MLTLVTTPKPFRGHIGMIQRNALQSWKCLHKEIEIILFGNESGAGEACRELGLRHVAHVERSPRGAKYLDYLLATSQELARHETLCYINCDIVLTREFRFAVEAVRAWRERFLMVGRRWDVDITQPIAFEDPDWQRRLLDYTVRTGRRIPAYNIDYFVFPKGMYREVPPLVVGRIWWDQWIVGNAVHRGIPVVDATGVVYAVHQNHDYGYHPGGQKGVFQDEESERNRRLGGGFWRLKTIADATHSLGRAGISRNHLNYLAPAGRAIRPFFKTIQTFGRLWIWHPALKVTKPARHVLNLRRETVLRPLWDLKAWWLLRQKNSALGRGSVGHSPGSGREAG